MGKIYAAPEQLSRPDYAKYQDFNKYLAACNEYLDKIKTWAKHLNPSCPEAGKEITFQVGDGWARYIVASMKPVALIHDDTGDAWEYEYAHRLTAADVRKRIQNLEGVNKLFASLKQTAA